MEIVFCKGIGEGVAVIVSRSRRRWPSRLAVGPALILQASSGAGPSLLGGVSSSATLSL